MRRIQLSGTSLLFSRVLLILRYAEGERERERERERADYTMYSLTGYRTDSWVLDRAAQVACVITISLSKLKRR